MSNYQKIPQDKYDKAKGQFRLALNDVFQPFNIQDSKVLIPGAIEEIVELAEQFGKRIRNHDVPIQLKKRRNPRRE